MPPEPAPGPARHRPVLGRLVGDPAEFAASRWGREPMLRRGADPGGFADLLDLDGIDELLSARGLRTPFLRLVRDGTVLDSATFTGPGGVGAEIPDQVRDDAVARLFAEGTTVVLQALHRTWPALVDLGARLGTELGHPVQVNAYVTPPSARGFSAHYDVHDVFVLQLAGRKHWTVHAPVHPDPLRDQPWGGRAADVAARARGDEPALDPVLEPGDVLYLPRGWLHAATALGEVSAHLTVGVHVLTRYALVEALAALVADDPALRGSLPLGLDAADPDALAPHLADVRTALVAALERVPAAAVARRVGQRSWTGTRPEPVRPVAAAAFTAGLGPADSVRLRAGLGHRFRPAGEDRVALELPDRTVTLPGYTAEAVKELLRGDPVAVRTLPGLDDADRVTLVRRLLREGVLVPDGAPATRGTVPR